MPHTGPTDAETISSSQSNHPGEQDGAELVGVSTRGAPFYYDSERSEIIEGLPGAENAIRHDVEEGGLSKFVQDVEDELESLTERAHELFADENSES